MDLAYLGMILILFASTMALAWAVDRMGRSS
jgi:hypothetical protein